MTKVTCCASSERKRNPVILLMIQFSTATEKANTMETAIVRTTKSAPRYGWVRIDR